MPDKLNCERCKGEGLIDALVNMHGDETVTITCDKCNGSGTVYVMNEEEERNYWSDYW